LSSNQKSKFNSRAELNCENLSEENENQIVQETELQILQVVYDKCVNKQDIVSIEFFSHHEKDS
jgi:hypothetical protein